MTRTLPWPRTVRQRLAMLIAGLLLVAGAALLATTYTLVAHDLPADHTTTSAVPTRPPGFVPGPLAPDEEGVYHFVSLMARRYQGEVPVSV